MDGSWCPIRAEKERSCSPQCPILVLGELSPQEPGSAGLGALARDLRRVPSPAMCQAPAPRWPPWARSEHRPLSPSGPSDANGLLSTPNVNGGGGGGALGGAGGGGGAAGGVENGKPGADVVDLTLDSSSSSEEEEDEEEDEEDEDEEGPRPKRRCPFQKGLVSAC